MVGALISWDFRNDVRNQRFPWGALRMTILLVAINLILWMTLSGQLAWETHLGGAVAGVIFGAFFGLTAINETDTNSLKS